MLRVFASGFGVLLATAVVAADNPKDKDTLQGLWQAVEMEANGQKAPDEVAKKFKVWIKADKLVFNPDTENREHTFMLDTKAKPKAMDLTPSDGSTKGKAMPVAIYELDGDKLRICLDKDGNQSKRPTEFKTKAGDGFALLTLKRVDGELTTSDVSGKPLKFKRVEPAKVPAAKDENLPQEPDATRPDDKRPPRIPQNPDGLSRAESYVNPDGTITHVEALPGGLVKVDGKVLSREEFENQRKKLSEYDPSVPRAKLVVKGDRGEQPEEQTAQQQPNNGLPWQVICVVALGVIVTLGLVWVVFRIRRRT
jgi:uncharacterized protein (TIGR03067 family)